MVVARSRSRPVPSLAQLHCLLGRETMRRISLSLALCLLAGSLATRLKPADWNDVFDVLPLVKMRKKMPDDSSILTASGKRRVRPSHSKHRGASARVFVSSQRKHTNAYLHMRFFRHPGEANKAGSYILAIDGGWLEPWS